jgi:hypothetical protein
MVKNIRVIQNGSYMFIWGVWIIRSGYYNPVNDPKSKYPCYNEKMGSLAQIFPMVIIAVLAIMYATPILAGPASENYELQQYGFGSGGIENASSSGYGMMGVLGEQAGQPAASENYEIGQGLTYTLLANLPPAPTLTNPGSTYDRLKLIIDPSGNAADAEFAVAISSDNWTSTQFVQDDFTAGGTMGTEDWQTYSDWGSATGVYITGLSQNTQYRVKVKARHGKFTETGWSAEATATTGTPTLTFSVSADTVTFNQLSPENSWTDSTKTTVLTTSTNAYNGYTVYGHETDPLTDSYSQTIADFASPNSNPANWSGTGFGYSTSDSNILGGTADRFTSGGPKFAGFTMAVPGDPIADHTEPVLETPIVNESHTVTYRVTAGENQAAGKYTTSIVYIVVPEY